jgi:hypothetical protein
MTGSILSRLNRCPHKFLLAALVCVGLALTGATAAQAAYIPLKNMMDSACSGIALCLQSSFTNASNTDSTVITGDASGTVPVAHVYGFRNSNNASYTVTSGIIGTRYTSNSGFNCAVNQLCMHYMLKNGSTILGTDKITMAISSDSISYTVGKKATGYQTANVNLTVTVKDTSLYGKPITLVRSRCSKISGIGFCSLASTSTSTLTITAPTKWDLAASTAIAATNYGTDKKFIDYKGGDPLMKTTHNVFKYSNGAYASNPTIKIGYSYTYNGAFGIYHSGNTSTPYGGSFEKIVETYPSSDSASLSTILSGTVSNPKKVNTHELKRANKNLTTGNIGKDICSQTWYSPSASYDGSGWVKGAYNYKKTAINRFWDYDDNKNTKCAKVISPWTISATSAVQANTKPEPGHSLVFTHKLSETKGRVVRNDSGSDVTINGTVYQYINDGNNTTKPASGWTTVTNLANVSGITNKTSGIGESETFYSKTSTIAINQSHVGKTICQFVRSSQTSRDKHSDGNSGNDALDSAPKCMFIPYNYQLIPETDPTGSTTSTTVSYGDPAFFQAKIKHFYDGPTKSQVANWEAFVFIIPNSVPKTTIPDYKQNVAPQASNAAGVNNAYGLTGTRNYLTIGTRDSQKPNPPTYCDSHNSGTWSSEGEGVFFPGKKTPGDPESTDGNIVCKTTNLTALLNNLDLGDRFCFALWVAPSWATPADQNPSNNRSYSKPSCLTVSKSPQLQLRGADSKSGAKQFGKTTLTSNNQGGFTGAAFSNPLRGSWSQYGLLAHGSGSITNFGSTGYTLVEPNRAKACKLLFANTDGDGRTTNCALGATGAFGQLGTTDRIISLPRAAELSATDLQNLVAEGKAIALDNSTRVVTSLNGLASGTYYIKKDLVITASTLKSGQHLVLAVPDSKYSVTIAGDITDGNATYNRLEDIPSLTIIADNISVAGYATSSANPPVSTASPVTKIYGTYIAKNRFNTCAYRYKYTSGNPTSDWAAASSALAGLTKTGPVVNPWVDGNAFCQHQLTVNGAVISKLRPSFLRTAGAGKDADTSVPSEILNYTPNTYLTPYALSRQGNNNNWQLTDVRQLPARL